MEIDLYLTKPCYNEQILTVPWPFVISCALFFQPTSMGFGHSYHRFFLLLKQQSKQGNDTAGKVLFCHSQPDTLLTKAFMTAGTLIYQNGNGGKNITLKIIGSTFFETSE